MNRFTLFSSVVVSLILSASLQAQTPAGATGQCKDGTYSTAAHKSGACSGHKGVQTWFAAGSAPAGTASPTTPTAPPTAPAPRSASAVPTSSAVPASGARAQAAGGGPGMVWVNTSSKVYHCYGGRDYGTTKTGKYESEASAKAEGARPAYGKACGQ